MTTQTCLPDYAAGPTTDVLADAPALWCAEAPAQNAYLGFLRTYHGRVLTIHVFATSTYHLYVDGTCINAGPTPHRAPVALVDTYTLDLADGDHEVFVLVNHFGMDTKWSVKGPGVFQATVVCDGKRLIDAEGWTVWPLRCWNPDTPRITWARAGYECLDTTHADHAVLRRYAKADHAGPAGDLPAPGARTTVTSPFTVHRPRLTPALAWTRLDFPAPPRIQRSNGEVFNLNDLAARLFYEQWHPCYDAEVLACRRADGTRIHRRVGDKGWILTYDLERICAGEMAITVTSAGPATIDLAFTERLFEGKPDPTRNGSRYVARVLVGSGTTRVRLAGFHGLRYLVVAAKDFVGDLTIAPPVIHECIGDIPYDDAFVTSDRVLDLIYDISKRSVVLNTQAVCFDCNTRELGAYWGDGVWIADLVGHFSGDFNHLRHLAWGMVDEYLSTGVISASLFGMGAPLFDYCLVPHDLLDRYLRCTGDAATVRAVLPVAAAILDDFLACADDRDCVSVEGIRRLCEERCHTDFRTGLLFLDHPGLGWHPRDSVGIDRRDANCGLQLFLLQALQAMSAMAGRLGIDDPWGSRCGPLAATIRERWYDADLGLLRDARLSDGSFAGCSQIVNALAVMTGVFSGDEARAVVDALLRIDERSDLAQSTPYGWFFIAEAACRTGQVRQALAAVRARFEPMLARGATTTWEAFSGDLHDSLNHAWSAVLPWLALRGLAGMREVADGSHTLRFTPALDALDECRIRGVLPQGPWELAWTRRGLTGRDVTVSLPSGVQATLDLGDRQEACGGGISRHLV